MKLLVNVRIPAISEQYDILVPDSVRIRVITGMIADTVETLSDYRYAASGQEQLCSAEKNILLRSNMTLSQYGICNGDHLMLI